MFILVVLVHNGGENTGFSNIYENMETDGNSVLKSESNTTSLDTPIEKKYDVRDDDTDDEGIDNPYGDMYLNEETICDILISDIESAINERRENDDDGFKREYAVSDLNAKLVRFINMVK